MPKVSPIQNNFGAGEFSPLLNGRADIGRYKSALATCLNYVPSVQGGLTRRSGTRFVANVKTSTDTARLIPFEFSVTQAYILEFGDLYFRIYKDNGRIEVATVPVEVVTPYSASELVDLKFVQSADVMYLVHPDYAPRIITRTSHTAWTIALFPYVNGPYLPINPTSTTLTPSAVGGVGVLVTASSTTGINDGNGFQSTDVGRYIRIGNVSLWGYGKIVTYHTNLTIDIDITENLPSTLATAFWQLGVWSDTTGWPTTAVFHEDRLGMAGVESYPQRIDLSETGIYESFASTEPDTTIVATNALNFTFNANDVNVVRWILSDEKGLVVGTTGGEWLVRPSANAEALSPTNITAKRSTTYGSSSVAAIQVGKAGLFLQRSGRKLRELLYSFQFEGFKAEDITVLSEHITESGITEMAHQKEPQPILWCVRADGVLAGVTYERGSDTFNVGWHRHVFGGVSDAGGSAAMVESVAVIPSSDESRREAWVVVKRWIDGAVSRSVEFITEEFRDTVEHKDAFFVDSGLSYDVPLNISGATKADPCVLTVTSHGLSNGDKVLISDVLGMSELNTNSYLVSNSTTHTFELTDLQGVDIDSTSFTTYVSGGEARKYITNISGLDHLEGETVSILADGAVQPDKVVASGSITLSESATTVHIGLGYNSDGKMLRMDAGAADGTSIGKTRRTNRMGIMFHRSLGLKIGYSFDDLTELTFRTASDPLSRAPELFTGIRSEVIDADYDFENQFCFRQDQPLPSTILALMPQTHVMDR